MAETGSILGNAVVRLEDPALLTGAGKYLDDLDSPERPGSSSCGRRSRTARCDRVDVEAASGMPGVLAVYHAGGDDLGLAPFQSFPMLPETFNRPVFAADRVRFVGDIVAAVVAETGAASRRRRRGRRGRRRPAAGRGLSGRRPGSPTPRCSSLTAGATLLRRPPSVPTRTRSTGPRSWPRWPWSASASPGCPWSPTAASWCPASRPGASPAGSRTRPRTRCNRRWPRSSGLEPDAGAGRVPVGRRRLRSEGGGVRRVPRGRGRGRHATRPAREVGGDPLRGHGGARPRPRLHHERQAGTHRRRQDRRPRRQLSSPPPVPIPPSGRCCRCSPR